MLGGKVDSVSVSTSAWCFYQPPQGRSCEFHYLRHRRHQMLLFLVVQMKELVQATTRHASVHARLRLLIAAPTTMSLGLRLSKSYLNIFDRAIHDEQVPKVVAQLINVSSSLSTPLPSSKWLSSLYSRTSLLTRQRMRHLTSHCHAVYTHFWHVD